VRPSHPPNSAISGYDGTGFQYVSVDNDGHLVNRAEVWNYSTLCWEVAGQPIFHGDSISVDGQVAVYEETKAVVVYESGTNLYVCKAVIGAALGDASWQIKKVDTSSGAVITWCDGNANYDNTATNLAIVAGHSYS
jgi:hypothetical protein